ncbi:MAG: SIMPL domain-containing protein [Rubricoccaceae bacterium]
MRLSLVLVAFAVFATSATAQSLAPPRTISVSGEAEILVIPDEVILQLAVETRDRDLTTATDDNQAAVEAVAAVAMRYGVPAQRIQTERIDLRPEYTSRRRDDGMSVQVLYEYHASRSINVTLRDLDVFDDLLRDVIAAGVNRVNGVEYRTTDLRTHRDNARSQAIDAAKEKAEALAGRLDQSLGKPLTISETGFASSFGRVAYSQNVISSAPVGAGVSTSPGQISIRANVSVVFELAD